MRKLDDQTIVDHIQAGSLKAKDNTDQALVDKLSHISPEEFDEILAGKTRIKPKIVKNPRTEEVYRLVPGDPNSESYSDARYVKVDMHPTTINFYELHGEALQKAAVKEIQPPREGLHVDEFRLQQTGSRELREDEISRVQLYELLTAIGTQSHWWPLDDPLYGAEPYFSRLKIHVLFDGKNPIGITCLDTDYQNKENAILQSFIGIIPEEKGKGVGGYLLDWSLKKAALMGADKILLCTSAPDIMSKREGQEQAPEASLLYKKRGFEFVRSEHYLPPVFGEKFDEAGYPIDIGKYNIPPAFFLHPDTDEQLGRYTQDVMQRRVQRAFGLE